MLFYTIKRFQRRPYAAMGVMLFAIIVSAVLCGLHASNKAELQNYDEVYHSVPVRFTVTNLTGTRTEKLHAPGWVADLFTGEGWLSPSLSEFATDIRIRMEADIADLDGLQKLVGLTTIEAAQELFPENGGTVNWYYGYDESIFAEDRALCLIPHKLADQFASQNGELELRFTHTVQKGLEIESREYVCRFTIAGTYTSHDSARIYCPYQVVETVYSRLGKEREIDTISAQLINNDDLDALRECAACWFAEPNATGQETPWDFSGYDVYPYALDIDDELLLQITEVLRQSLAVNMICTVLVFALSAAVGFFVGFLMIRSQKWEISLMRTMGTSKINIYIGVVLEQIVCVTLGTLIGGSAFLCQPAYRLLAFVGIYFVGLNIALLFFINTNLLATIKENK